MSYTLVFADLHFLKHILFSSVALLGHSFLLFFLSIGFSNFILGSSKWVRFENLVDSPSKIELFKEKYHIPQEMGLQYCSTEQIVTNKEVGEVIIPIIAFIEGGMTLPMDRITKDYLINHRLCPHQCAPNMFRILGYVDALNKHLQLGLTWHDVVHMYEFHS